LITGVESTFEEVTVDSLSFRSKNELGIGWTMLRGHCHGPAKINFGHAEMTLRLRTAAEMPLPKAAASIGSP
jgi:hypothetical protein